MSNGQLQLLMVDTSTEDGSTMFGEDTGRLGMDQAGVPQIDFGDGDYLVGSGDIPEQFPGVVAEGLAGEGLTWPPVPGLAQAIAPFIEDGSVPDPAGAGGQRRGRGRRCLRLGRGRGGPAARRRRRELDGSFRE